MPSLKSVFFGLALLALSAAAALADDPAKAAAPAPSPGMLEGLSPETIMNLADDWGMQSDENKVISWTTSKELHFQFADGTKTVIRMPADRMVVSIAPYIMKTHPCKDHTPSSCRGELASTPVDVKAVTADGTVILEEKTKTLPNGFIDLWLPRDKKIEVTLKARGLTVTQRVGRFDSDKTCYTEAKLHP